MRKELQDLAEIARRREMLARRVILAEDPQIAAEQWKIKRDKYKARHGDRWPRRYNGGDRAEQYLQQWNRLRARAEEAAE